MRDQLTLIRTAIIIGYRKGTKVGEYSEQKEHLTESSAGVSLDTHVHDHRFMTAKIGNQHGERKCEIYVCLSLSVMNSESMSFAAHYNWGHYVT